MKKLIIITIVALSLVNVFANKQIASNTEVTVYNSNFAMVKDKLNLKLQPGNNIVHFNKVTNFVETDSVFLNDLLSYGLTLYEQRYRLSSINSDTLLQQNEGKLIEFEMTDKQGKKTRIKGRLVRAPRNSQQPIVVVNEEMIFYLPGQPIFKAQQYSEDLLKPTLSWEMFSPKEQEVSTQINYITGGLSWSASYNLVIQKNEAYMNAWITMNNNSGKNFDSTKFNFMAGDIQKINNMGYRNKKNFQDNIFIRKESNITSSKNFDEFHLYTIQRHLNLKNLEQKQVNFISSSPFKVQRTYVYDMQNNSRNIKGKVDIYLNFENKKDNSLGIALPKGLVRLYNETDEERHFIGEAQLDHTPKDEKVSLLYGQAFNLVAKNSILNKYNNSHAQKREFTLKNRGEETVTIIVRDRVSTRGSWIVKNSGVGSRKINQNILESSITLEPNQEKTFTYNIISTDDIYN